MTTTTAGGRFDRTDRARLFLASHVHILELAVPVYDHVLVAVNDIQNAADIGTIERWIADGKRVFMDSGIYVLAMEHARKHGVTHDRALAMAPDEVDGFDALFARYVSLAKRLGDELWGYIELDLGGKENKRRTRARLEALGLRPIPVYHPLVDGWDYFDELASEYDRICVGNVVQANTATRKRLLATLWERKRKYPGLWIHLLGLRPNQYVHAFPFDSADCSTWLGPLRWFVGYREQACGATFSRLDQDYRHRLGAPAESPEGHHKALGMAAYGAAMQQRAWRAYLDEATAVGLDPWGGVAPWVS